MLALALSKVELVWCLAWSALFPSQLPVSPLLPWALALSRLAPASFLAWLALSPAQLAVFCALSDTLLAAPFAESPTLLPEPPVFCLASSVCSTSTVSVHLEHQRVVLLYKLTDAEAAVPANIHPRVYTDTEHGSYGGGKV